MTPRQCARRPRTLLRKGGRTHLAIGGCICFWAVLAATWVWGEDKAGTSSGPLQIRTVCVTGLEAVEEAYVLKRVHSRAGAVYQPELVNEDLRRVIIMPEIASARLDTRIEGEYIDMTFVVEETPRIAAVKIAGNKHLTTEALGKVLKFKEGDFLDHYLVRRGTTELREHYRKKGYYYAEAALDEASLKDKNEVVYIVTEGPKLRIKKVRFEGNTSIGAGKLKGKIKTGAYFPIFNKGRLDEQQLEQDRWLLTAYYHEKGYLDARIFSRTEFNEEKTRAVVTFVIEEGPLYQVHKVLFAGHRQFDSEVLTGVVSLQTGKAFTKDRQEQSTKAIKNLYGQLGYIYTDIKLEPEFTETAGEVDVVFKVDEKEQYQLGRLIIQGNAETQDKVIRREFSRYKFLPGELYDLAAMEKAQRRLEGSGYFEDVKVTPVGAESGRRDALVEVAEGRTGLLLFGVGVDTNSGVLGQIQFSQRNFDASDHPESFTELITGQAYKGGGQRFTVNLEPGTEVTRGSVSFYEPYLFDQPYYMNVTAYHSRRWRESYYEKRLGGSVTFGHHFENNWDADITFRLEEISVEDLDEGYALMRDPGTGEPIPQQDGLGNTIYVTRPDPQNPGQVIVVTDDEGNPIPKYQLREIDVAPADIQEVKGNNFLTSIAFGVSRDMTDRMFRPTEGYKLSASWEQAGAMGGDFNFSRVQAGVSIFYPVYEDLAERRTVLSARLNGGTIIGDAPPFERYYLGGIGSLRGFDYRGVSPHQRFFYDTQLYNGQLITTWNEDVVGSDSMVIAGTELNFPLYEETFFGKIFCDAGMVTEGPLRVTVGFGLDILVPQLFQMIPMQFDFGFPVYSDDEDDEQVFSFSFGVTF